MTGEELVKRAREPMTTPIEGTTPRPWHTWHGDDSYAMNCAGVTSEPCDHEYVDDDGHAQHMVALTLLQQPRYASCADDWDANAALIVAAVNDYDRLRAIEDAARAVDREWYSLDFEERLEALREALR